ncbi:MAG: lipoyl(octanoyl) transferase LipB [Desulfobacteraceae bacterium]|nr:lipoyl(octanoyl) transferase LipB [Desulfobacteraceae bacterium]
MNTIKDSAPQRGRREWLFRNCAPLDYEKARDLQLRLVKARMAGFLASDILLLLEHPPVFTLGRRGGRGNLRVSEDFLEKSGISVIHAERGGDVTYHGPGQLVGYPIMNLHAGRITVTEYVEKIEEVMIRTAGLWGVKANRDPRNRGVWVGNSKIGSIGIAIRRGVSFHGFAFNVNTDLEPFGWINPCGLTGIGVTSLSREVCRNVDVLEVRPELARIFEEVFGVSLGAELPASCAMSCLDLHEMQH